MDIDAQTQPGYVDSPLIEVRGEVSGTTIPAVGLRVRSSKINIRGVAINHFGIDISIGDQNSSTRADNNIVSRCIIGMNADGMTFDPAVASTFGISVNGNTKDNLIGGPTAATGNVIGNCITGVALAGPNVDSNSVTNNKIGTNKTGFARIGNNFGVVIGNGAKNNVIGGELDNDTNLISGNFLDGIGISGTSTLNRISGNLIGTNINGDMAIPNDRSSINILNTANQNTIGGNTSERNIISGNRRNDRSECWLRDTDGFGYSSQQGIRELHRHQERWLAGPWECGWNRHQRFEQHDRRRGQFRQIQFPAIALG